MMFQRFSVLLNFHVPPTRLKIPAMSTWSTNRVHTSNEYEVWIDFILPARKDEVLIDFILLQNGRNRFHKTGTRRFSKRFSVLLNFHVPPRLKIPAMSTWSTNRFHTSKENEVWIDFILPARKDEVLIGFILLQNGRNRFHKTGARRFSKRFSVLLNFHVPPRLKIPVMSTWSTNRFHTSKEYEVWIDFILPARKEY